MRLPRERFDYSPIASRPRWTLPKGARIAVWTIVNVEEWDIEKPMARQYLTAPQGVATVPDVPNWAWHEYGMRVGFWRLKAALDRHHIQATMAVNASVCVSYPRLAQAAHAVRQGAMHVQPDQRAVIRDSIEILRRFTGRKPKGWLGPGLTETFETLDLLAEAGIEYVSDWVNDDQPYPIRTRHGTLVSVPYSIELNDIPMMVIHHHPSGEWLQRCKDYFDRVYAEGARNPRVMAIAVHPYNSGVPHRIKYFEAVYDYMRKKRGVWFATGEEIYEWYKAHPWREASGPTRG